MSWARIRVRISSNCSHPLPLLTLASGRHESMNSEANEECSLGLVFFDIIYLNSEPLHAQPYSRRREILEDLICQEPGKTILADRYPIKMTAEKPELCLQRIFSEHIADHQEGLVLKAEDSRYNDYRKPWVKLKKDYIPGFGDTLDLVILGANWEKVRGRSLRGG
jgi:DNA ligase-4